MISPINDSTNPCEKESNCQVKSNYENMSNLARELTILDRAWLLTRRLPFSIVNRLKKGKRSLSEKFGRDQGGASGRHMGIEKYRFKKGDLVEVKPIEEIRALLKDGKTGGLGFMSGMEQYCGTQARVLKRVKYIFDEREWGMLKCDSVLLENVICNGKYMGSKDGCDRSCFFFWKDVWLRKL